ncbi:MAG TPA: S8 family peptidase [Gemmatimonadaceae bacterium]|jgi:hypothetical protein|nr:S8 family peptidase [Gemmatimonadaceae bacterium]
MPISLPRKFVESILLGPMNDRRQLQDSPILGDVWVAFADKPDRAHELLITPHRERAAGTVAIAIDEQIARGPRQEPQAEIAPLHGVVAARLYFAEVLSVVVPMTGWWHERRVQADFNAFLDPEQGPKRLARVIEAIRRVAQPRTASVGGAGDSHVDRQFGAELFPAFDRYLALAGLILWAAQWTPPTKPGARKGARRTAASQAVLTDDALAKVLTRVKVQQIQRVLRDLLGKMPAPGGTEKLVWQISLNRKAMPALQRSVPAVKADAARTLFSVDCSKIAWGVIDSGIQGGHAAFSDAKGRSRVKGSFDFSQVRKIVSLENRKANDARERRLDELLHDGLANKPDRKTAVELLEQLAKDAAERRSTHWELVRPFVEIKPATRPNESDHGTHVAGIIGANRNGRDAVPDHERGDFADGMCPDIQLYDFRVLSPDAGQTEFAIIAALQFIRYLNTRTDYITIHGANLSLSIPHDVRNYACGKTPICVECERLVDSGVVVVAAAGNLGYQSFTTREGSYEGYAAFSITDPGNADGVITVGATHRYAPHTYGVSFFSSRGPTGDGRPKPDLVAPGERIRGPFRDGWGDLDGTSMAAPHVSGAAAMLMARYSELIGQPRRIKQLLCESATDLGRERSFQGNGMLDVLRAFQGT